MLRVGLVGAGWIAADHVAALAKRDDAEVVAVCDVDRPRAQQLAPAGAAVYEDWHELLERGQAAASSVLLGQAEGERGDIEDAATLVLQHESGALSTIVVGWTRQGLPGIYDLGVVASEATLELELDPDFSLHGVSKGEPVEA